MLGNRGKSECGVRKSEWLGGLGVVGRRAVPAEALAAAVPSGDGWGPFGRVLWMRVPQSRPQRDLRTYLGGR